MSAVHWSLLFVGLFGLLTSSVYLGMVLIGARRFRREAMRESARLEEQPEFLPAISLFAFCIAGVSLGIAQGAIEYFVETMRSRTSYYTGRNLADFVTVQVHLAEAAAIADAVRAVLLGDCDEATASVDTVRPAGSSSVRVRRSWPVPRC